MKVTLLWSTPVNSAYVAAKRCVCSKSGDKIWTDSLFKSKEEMERFLAEKIIPQGHMQVLEHIVFTFAIDDISRVASHQFVRTRMASMCQQSQRYVDSSGDGFVLPDSIAGNPSAMIAADDVFQASLSTYEALVKMGIPQEDARYLMPQASKTSIVVTINASSFLHLIEYRTCMSAQKEYRAIAWKMLDQAKKVYPTLFKNAGPPCRGKNPRCIGHKTKCSQAFLSSQKESSSTTRNNDSWKDLYDEQFTQ